MSQRDNFFRLDDMSQGMARELAPGLTTRILPGEHAMLSVARIEPNQMDTVHHHPQEQWGVCLEGSATRFQGDDAIAVKTGDFWRTPGRVPPTMEAGPEGCTVLDVFAPPREAYREVGSGFGTEEVDTSSTRPGSFADEG